MLPNIHKEFEKNSKRIDRVQKFIIGWFVFVGVISLAMLAGVAWLVYTLLAHFQVI